MSREKVMNKCNHDWEVSPDQSDTGTMGVRMKCRHCLRVTTIFNPHHYKDNGSGAAVCTACGHTMTIPDWPPYCLGEDTATKALSTSTSSGSEADKKNKKDRDGRK